MIVQRLKKAAQSVRPRVHFHLKNGTFHSLHDELSSSFRVACPSQNQHPMTMMMGKRYLSLTATNPSTSTISATSSSSSSSSLLSSSLSTTQIHFDTYRVVKHLESQGFTVANAEAILQVIITSMNDTLDAQKRVLATKSEHIELKAELSERVFNSTLKFDIAQRHMRELLERDFNNLKQEIRMLEKMDFDKIRVEIAELEKKFLLQKQAEDETLNELRLSMEKVEKRMLQYAVGFAGTIMAVGAALMRLFL